MIGSDWFLQCLILRNVKCCVPLELALIGIVFFGEGGHAGKCLFTSCIMVLFCSVIEFLYIIGSLTFVQ